MSVTTGNPISSLPSTAFKGTLIIPAVDQTLPIANQNVSIEASTLISSGSGSTLPYDIAFFVPGSPYNNSQIFGSFVMVKTVVFPANFAGSYASVSSSSFSPSASATINILQNSTNIGSIEFAPNSTSGIFTSSGGLAITLNPGDVLSFVNQTISDATLGNLAISLSGSIQ